MNDSDFTDERFGGVDRARMTGLGSGLRRLHDLDDYEVASGNPDVRGWEVRSADGQRLGKVDDLIVSVAELRVRYLDIDAVGGGHALIPIEAAQLDDERDDVVVNDVTVIRRNYDRNGTEATSVPGSASPDGPHGRHHGMPQGDRGDRDVRLDANRETLDASTRRVDAGEAEVRKHVETGHVRDSVPLRHDEVTPERHPLEHRPMDAAAMDAGQEIRVPLMREEATVAKRPVVREEIVIRRRLVTVNKSVEADLRREHIEVEGAAENRTSPRANP